MKEKFRGIMNRDPLADRAKEDFERRRESSEKNADAYTVVLAAVSLAIAVLFFVYKELWLGLGFVGLSALLGLMAFFSYRSRRSDREVRERLRQQDLEKKSEEPTQDK